jgi:LysR family transcriptional regulator for bpeEF and oprC
MRVFNRVADRGSFARAADEMDLSRAAVSAHVAALEKHLGVRLLHRTTRKVSLTSEGTEFLQRSRRILDDLREAEEIVRDARSKPEGQLRVDVPGAFGRYLLLPALPEFRKLYPGIEMDIRLNDHVVDLVADQVDVAVRVGHLQQSGIVARRIIQTRFVTCASPAYLDEFGEPDTPDDLKKHRLLGLVSPQGGPPEWTFPAPYTPKRLNLHFYLQFNSVEAPVIAAASGLGIAHSSDLLFAEFIAEGELKLILRDFVAPGPPVSLVYPSAGHQSAKVRAFSDFAADLMRGWSDTVRTVIAGGTAPDNMPNTMRSLLPNH